MKQTVILTVTEKKGLFSAPYEQQECGNLSVVSIQSNMRALKKLRKRLSDENIVISHKSIHEKIFRENTCIYEQPDYQTILPVINKLCRQTAQKFNLQLPLGEIYIVASPSIACAIAANTYSLSRIFTVISEEDTIGNIYDELYFKHGTLIRHLPEFNNNITDDSIIIRCDSKRLPSWVKLPVIDMSPCPLCANYIVKARDIFIYDEKIHNIQKCWGGISGADLYSLAGEIPSAEAQVDINKKADRIFLLDTNQI